MSQANPAPRPAFDRDVRAARLGSAAKALWWSANRAAGQAMIKPHAGDDAPAFQAKAPPPPKGLLLKAWREAFAKDAADIAAGLYPYTEAAPADPIGAFRRAYDLLDDARAVDARRRRRGGVEAREHAPSDAYPPYYRQNFHYQSGGWFTDESAERYEVQVETLFSGTAGPMRRRALSLLAKAWGDVDQRGLVLVDLACGSGSFLSDLKATFPRAKVSGLDLSPAYVAKAAARSGEPVIQAAAERLPFADNSVDGLTCIYLFHELPPKVRRAVAREMARVLKPGGVLAFADSLQVVDEPDLARLLEAFPAFFHEPFYASYQDTDLPALFSEAGLKLQGEDRAFLTKALLLQKSAG
ncbi:MAG: class I SAM-dependent methyltransferase [Caulobacteraceae bacterium]